MSVWIFLCLAWLMPSTGEINNTAANSHSTYTIEFTEDLTFGSDEEDDIYIWPASMSSVRPNHRGHMYVADTTQMRILEFDENGKFVKLLAGPGQGPGELQGLHSMHLLNDGSMVVFESTMGFVRMKFIDKNMNYVRDVPTSNVLGIPQSILVSPLGTQMGSHFSKTDLSNAVMTISTGFLDMDYKVLKTLSSNDAKLSRPTNGYDKAFFTKLLADGLKTYYQPIGVYNFLPDGRAITAVSDTYQVTIYNADLAEKQLVFTRQYKPIINDEANREALAENLIDSMTTMPGADQFFTKDMVYKAASTLEHAVVKPAIYGFIPMEDGHLLVVRDVALATRHNQADIFTKDGQFVGEVSMGNHGFLCPSRQNQAQMTFKNGFAYTMTIDENGENRVTRFRYKMVKR